MSKITRKKPLIIGLIIISCSILFYCGAWLYCRQCIWLPHLPDQSKIDYVEKSKSRTYYYLKMDNDGYLYRMSTPTLCGFAGGHCVFDVVSCLNFDNTQGIVNDDGVTEYHQIAADSNYSYTLAGRLSLDGKIKSFGCMVNVIVPEENCATEACFWISPDLELENMNELSDAELNLYQKSIPEIKVLCENICRIFSV